MNTTVEKIISAPAPGSTSHRFCTNCNTHKPAHGGMWVLFNSGRNRRWKCSDCYAYSLTRRA